MRCCFRAGHPPFPGDTAERDESRNPAPLVALVMASTVACTGMSSEQQGTMSGAGIGAAAGAGIAALSGGNGWTGAAVGAVAGGIVGNIKGREAKNQ